MKSSVEEKDEKKIWGRSRRQMRWADAFFFFFGHTWAERDFSFAALPPTLIGSKNNPTNIGDLRNTSELSLRYFEVKLSL